MKCHQCEQPAFWATGEKGIPLCLNCSEKLQSIVDRQFVQNAAMMNLASEEMDAATGYICPSPRIPLTDVINSLRKTPVLNNISVTKSNIGMLNAGDFSLSKIDAAITMSKGTDVDPIGREIRRLTQAIVDSTELENQQRKQILELVQSLGEQIVGQRKQSVALALLKAIEDRAQGAAAVLDLTKALSSAISAFFAR